MHDDPHRSMTVKVTGPDSKSALFATRCREAWRSFWRHRADEVHATWEFFGDHFVLVVSVMVALLIAVIIGSAVIAAGRRAAECAETCDVVGHDDGLVHNGECYCIGEAGRPVLLETLLNRGTVWYVESCGGDK